MTDHPIPCAWCFGPLKDTYTGLQQMDAENKVLSSERFCSIDHADKYLEFKRFQAENR